MNADWGYSGEIGPRCWAGLDPEYEACKGHEQSPIALWSKEATTQNRTPPELITCRAQVCAKKQPNNINFVGFAGSALRLDGVSYELDHLHFHTPAEHKLDGLIGRLEGHFVFKTADQQIAVLGLVFEQGPANPTIDKLWSLLPNTTKPNESVSINPADLIPKPLSTLAYQGSLTTPPCTENVRWFVALPVLTISSHQIQQFTALIGANARPLQPLKGRNVELVNSR